MMRTLMEVLVLVTISALLGLGANSLKTRSLKLDRNYFERTSNQLSSSNPEGSTATEPTVPVAPAGATAVPAKPTEKSDPAHPKHDFIEVSTEQVVEIFKDPKRESGLYVFVDARSDEKYAEGRIPGAVQCDHYYLDNYLDAVLEKVNGAEKVVVYCNGGTCEDSIFVCQDLRDSGVPVDSICLYSGGWTEWTSRSMPVEKAEPEE
jgi:rhodanese-related sulfurtransferase